MPFQRPCPKCGKTLNYKRELFLQRVERVGSLCGSCAQSKIPRAYPHPKARLRPFEALYNNFVKRAVYDGKIVDLSYEDFLEFTGTVDCFYCGDQVTWTKYTLNKGSYASNLDRKNNSLGYSKGNCVVCCQPCNRTKSSRFTFEEFSVMMAALKQFRLVKALKIGAAQ